ncbi:MAG: tRNA dihydrouridine synthase DusB [Candidatus Caenarcaniphilales bacterium]|nr:tRNA dihydrouridine synthase DusB [Candidatus Caenarcaniphilales bacterium]
MPRKNKSSSLENTLETIYIPPMAGVTDLVFRRLMRTVLGKYASRVRLSTEMISSKGIMYQNNPTRLRLTKDEIGKVVIQLFGHEPDTMAKAAQIAQNAGASAIDINMGCPVPKIVRGKDGAALMKEPCLAEEIVKEVIAAVDIPVSVKTRLGWSEQEKNIKEFALRLQDAGISSLTVHGRTRAQAYTGKANWEAISEVNELLEIPVYANGDIDSAEKAKQALEVTNCHGVAIARASIGNPWVVMNAAKVLSDETLVDSCGLPSIEEKLRVALIHLELAYEDKGETGVQALKRHMSKYVSGHREASKLRTTLALAKSYEEMKRILEEYLAFV